LIKKKTACVRGPTVFSCTVYTACLACVLNAHIIRYKAHADLPPVPLWMLTLRSCAARGKT